MTIATRIRREEQLQLFWSLKSSDPTAAVRLMCQTDAVSVPLTLR